MDDRALDRLAEADPGPAPTRRGLLRGGLALAASGLLLPADLAAQRGRGRKPGELRERRRDRREAREDRRDDRRDDPPPGKLFLKDIVVALVERPDHYSLNSDVWVVAGGKRARYDRFAPLGDMPFGDDEGWIVFAQGKDSQGQTKGYGIFIDNPAFQEVWFETRTNVSIQSYAFGSFGVDGGERDVPRTDIREEGDQFSFDLRNGTTATLSRRRDTQTKNFALAFRRT